MVALLLVSVSLGLSNFAAAIGIGLIGLGVRERVRIALVFGFFEAAMPVAGLIIGERLGGELGAAGQYVGAGLLVLTGCYVLSKAIRQTQRGTERTTHQLALQRLLVTGFALSLDNLIVGFALSFSRTPILGAALVIALVSVSMTLAGLELGQRIGKRLEKWSEELGGAVLIIVGLALACEALR